MLLNLANTKLPAHEVAAPEKNGQALEINLCLLLQSLANTIGWSIQPGTAVGEKVIIKQDRKAF